MNYSLSLSEWYLHYPSWVIGDGEPDFAVGDVFDWRMVSLWRDESLTIATQRTKQALPCSDFCYRIVGQITYLSKDGCVIDFGGLQAVAPFDVLPSGSCQSEYVSGVVTLLLPLVTEFGPDIPLSVQRWKVKRVFADLTPYVQGTEGGLALDRAHRRNVQIQATSEISTHTYILECELMGPGSPVPVGSSGVLRQ